MPGLHPVPRPFRQWLQAADGGGEGLRSYEPPVVRQLKGGHEYGGQAQYGGQPAARHEVWLVAEVRWPAAVDDRLGRNVRPRAQPAFPRGRRAGPGAASARG